jgi:hypothetical protein
MGWGVVLKLELGMVLHICNPSIWEAKARGFQVLGQPCHTVITYILKSPYSSLHSHYSLGSTNKCFSTPPYSLNNHDGKNKDNL